MATQYQHDNEPFIVERVFDQVFDETETAHPAVSRKKAREIIFAMLERGWKKKEFPGVKSTIVREQVTDELSRPIYHSLVTKYFKRLATVRNYKAETKTHLATEQWSNQLRACYRAESGRIAREANYHILSPDGEDAGWEPEYDGPIWDD